MCGKESATLDKHAFLQLFPVAGLMGERLFKLFDKNGNSEIDFEELLTGVTLACRGTEEETIDFLFALYDLSGEGYIKKSDLTTILHNMLPAHERQFFNDEVESASSSDKRDKERPRCKYTSRKSLGLGMLKEFSP